MNKSTQTGCVEVKKKSNSTQTDPDLSVDLFEESITESTIIIQSAQTEGVDVETQTDVPDLSDEVEDMFNEDPSVMQISESEESEDADDSIIESSYILEDKDLT